MDATTPEPVASSAAPRSKKPYGSRIGRQRAFLRALARTGNISQSARIVGINRTCAEGWRARDPVYAKAWEQAMEQYADYMEGQADRRATLGTRRIMTYQGEPITYWADADGNPVLPGTPGAVETILTEHYYSDNLLMFRLKALRPEKYRDNWYAPTTGQLGATEVTSLAQALATPEGRAALAAFAGQLGRTPQDVDRPRLPPVAIDQAIQEPAIPSSAVPMSSSPGSDVGPALTIHPPVSQ